MEPALADLCDRGVVPAYALVFLVDATAGVSIDLDPDSWSFTSDLSVRVPLAPVSGHHRLHPGRDQRVGGGPPPARLRSSSAAVVGPLLHRILEGAATTEGDPPKVPFSAGTVERMKHGRPLEEPLRVAGGFQTVDRAPAWSWRPTCAPTC